MRAVRMVLYLAAGLVALIAVLLVLLFTLDFGRFKPQAESVLSDLLGRDFTIDGPLHLTLDVRGGLQLEASNVRLASPAWTAEPEFASLRQLSANVDIWTLFGEGPIVIRSINTDGLRLNLERDADGNSNWQFDIATAEAAEVEVEEGEAQPLQLPIVPAALALSDSVITLRTPDLVESLRLAFDSHGEVELLAHELSLNVSGDLNNNPLQLQLLAAPVEDSRDLRIELSGALQERTQVSGPVSMKDSAEPSATVAEQQVPPGEAEVLTVRASGSVSADTRLAGSKVRAQLQAPAIDRLLAVLGLAAPAGEDAASDIFAGLKGEPLSVAAAVHVGDTDVFIDRLEAEIADTRLELGGRFDVEDPLRRGRLDLSGSSPDLRPLLLPLADFVGETPMPLDLVTTVDWQDNLWSFKEGEVALAHGRLKLQGDVSGPPSFDRTDLGLDLDIPRLSELSALAGRELPALPARLRFKLRGQKNRFYADELAATVGSSAVSGALSVRYGEIPSVDLDLESQRLDLRPFMPPEPVSEPDPDPQPAATRASRRSADVRLIPDTPLPVELLQAFNATVDVRIAELLYGYYTLQQVAVSGQVSEGALSLETLRFSAPRGGELKGRFAVQPSASGAVVKARVRGESLIVGLPAESQEEARKLPRYDFNLALITEGATVRELAAVANGYLWLEAGKGKIRAGALQIFTNDFGAQLLATINPFSQEEPYSNVQCSAILAKVEDGQVEGKPIAIFQSDRLQIISDAEVDLKTEQLRMQFNTVPQRGLGFSMTSLINPFVVVSGTLGRPLLTIDPESTLIHGGAAIATGGLSILAKGVRDRFFSSKDPCGQAMMEAEKDVLMLEEKYGTPQKISSP